MECILITSPNEVKKEIFWLNYFLENGLDRLHIRKPFAKEKEINDILEEIPKKHHQKIALHDAHQLAEKHEIGLHFNKRNPINFTKKATSYSYGCHNIDEVKKIDPRIDYVFLSPIFDSISKRGYTSKFQLNDLSTNLKNIELPVYALGGISLENIPLIQNTPMKGVAILGSIWRIIEHEKEVKKTFKKIITKCHSIDQ